MVRRRARSSVPSRAERADRLDLYQRSVQQPEVDVALFDRIYRREFGRRPLVLREDFCGTAAVACAWVRSHPRRTSRGIDLDPEVLIWGAVNNQRKLAPAERKRVQLVQGDVRRVVSPPADIVAAQNFSFCIFQTRRELLRYFRAAHRALGRRGLLVLDVLGGFETRQERHEEERRERRGVRYVWEQKRFDPIAERAVFAIHFRFDDGSELRDAFVYDWRLWSIPELRDALADAGFRKSVVYWEGDDDVWRPRASAPAEAVWLAAVVGVK